MARGSLVTAEHILYGNLQRRQATSGDDGHDSKNEDLFRGSFMVKERLSFKQFQSIARSKAAFPKWAKYHHMDIAHVRKCKRGLSKENYYRVFADFYPPGTLIEFEEYCIDGTRRSAWPHAPQYGDQGEIKSYDFNKKRIEVDWNSPTTTMPLFFADQFAILSRAA